MDANNLIKKIEQKYEKISPFLDERSRRIWAALEAKDIGYGGQRIVHKATNIAITTIRKGLEEIAVDGEDKERKGRVRKKGGGRKTQAEKDPTLKEKTLTLVEASTKGDPEAPLFWCSKSLRNIEREINKDGHCASHTHIAKVLKQEGYSMQMNRKSKEGGSHVDRDAQFNYISNKTKDFQKRNQPVISVDTKKKELIGEFKNNGAEYAKKGQPTEVNVYDFVNTEKGKAVPYGVYDIAENRGFVNVGVSADTAEFSVNSLRAWWEEMGQALYKNATEIYINADGGGSNGSRVRLWKIELQKFANEIRKTIHVSHFPPGTSKWNKIEHKMFCFISKNWRGRPLVDQVTVVQLIGNTATKDGLKIKAKLDERQYEKGVKISDEELAKVNLIKDDFHGEWNYKIAVKE